MIAESPTSPRQRDRIGVAAVGNDALDRMHTEAEATGRTVAQIAADWLDTYQPPTRRVVAVVWGVDEEGERRWRSTTHPGDRFRSAYCALCDAECEFLGPDGDTVARIEQAGPARYELVVDR